jgi:polyisoprenoid-binding protein YceI
MTGTRVVTPNKTTTWQVDPAHTNVEFAVKHLMIATVRGRFSDVTGTVTVAGRDFSQAVVETVIGVSSIDTRDPRRDAHLKSPDFFDVERFPAITFRSLRVERASPDGDHFRLVGDLTLHGVTKEIVLDATLQGLAKDGQGSSRAGFSATGTINRKDFDLGWNQLLETGGVVVSDEVRLTIDAEVVAKSEAQDR